MVKFNIRPAELQTKIRATTVYSWQVWSNKITYSLGASWKDPQYHAFIAQIDSMSSSMRGNAEAMAASKKFTNTQMKIRRAEQEYKKLNPW